jgi:hypothetical protein
LKHTYTWRIHSEKFAKKVAENQFEIVNGFGALNIFSISPIERESRIEETRVEEVMTPQRPDDIRKISLKTLLIENKEKAKHTSFLTVLQPKDAIGVNAKAEITVTPVKAEGLIGMEIISEKYVELFLYSRDGKINYGDIQSTSNWVSQVKDTMENLVKTTEYSIPKL